MRENLIPGLTMVNFKGVSPLHLLIRTKKYDVLEKVMLENITEIKNAPFNANTQPVVKELHKRTTASSILHDMVEYGAPYKTFLFIQQNNISNIQSMVQSYDFLGAMIHTYIRSNEKQKKRGMIS